MTRQQLRLGLHDVGELAFENFGNAGVKRPTRFAQQGAIGGVLHQRVLEEIGRVSAARPAEKISPD